MTVRLTANSELQMPEVSTHTVFGASETIEWE